MTIFIPQSVAQSLLPFAWNVVGNSRDYFSNIVIVV